jgi:hypothetical protein
VKQYLKLPKTQALTHLLPPWHQSDQYCEFHRAVGHATDNCRTLRVAIQDLVDSDGIHPEGAEPTSTSLVPYGNPTLPTKTSTNTETMSHTPQVEHGKSFDPLDSITLISKPFILTKTHNPSPHPDINVIHLSNNSKAPIEQTEPYIPIAISDPSEPLTFNQHPPPEGPLLPDPLSIRAIISKALNTLSHLCNPQESSFESRCLQARHCLDLANHFEQLAHQLCQSLGGESQQLNKLSEPMLTKPQGTSLSSSSNQSLLGRPG